MPGRVAGSVFKVILGNVPEETAAQLFPRQASRIAEMDDRTMYPWDDFTDLAQTIAAKLPPETLVHIGRKVIEQALPAFARVGYASTETLLKDWGGLFNRYIHGASARDLVRTETYAPGRAVIVGGVAQPAKLVEGYLRAAVEAYGGTVSSFTTTPVIIGGSTYNRFVITWESV